MVPPAVVTLWVPGIPDVGESLLALLAFRLLVLSGFVGTVVDVVVGSLAATREVLLAAAVGLCWAEFDITLVTDVSDTGTLVSAIVAVGVAVGVAVDVGAALFLPVAGSELASLDSFCSSVLKLTSLLVCVPMASPMDKDNTESIRVLAGSLSLSIAPALPQDPEALLTSLPPLKGLGP